MAGQSGSFAHRFAGARFTGRMAQTTVLACGLVLIALVWIGLVFHLDQRKQTVLDQTRHDVTNLSVAIAEQVGRLIEGTDQVMRFMQTDHDTDPDTFDFAAWAKRASYLDDVAIQIAMFGETGELIASKIQPPASAGRVDVSDRAYFRHLAEHPDAGLYVEKTVKGRIQKRWALQLARRLNRLDGRFAGVVVVSLDPDYLTRQFRAVDVGQSGSISLFGLDGYIRARWPTMPGMYDLDARTAMQGASPFDMMQRTPVGTYQVRSPLDGVSRIFGYRSLQRLPMVVTVGKSVGDVLAGYRGEERRILALGAAITLMLLAGTLALIKELDRRQRRETLLVEAHEAVARSEARYRLIADNSTDMIVQLDATGLRLFVSPGSRKLFGHEPERLIGTRPQEFVHPDDRGELERTIENLAGGACDSTVSSHRFRHRDGRWIWVEASWQVIRNETGARTGFVASVRDATDRHDAEAAMRASEARYRTLADTLPQIVWLARASDGEAFYVNTQFEWYCGPIGSSADARRALVHPDDLAEQDPVWKANIAAGRACEGERRLRRHDGVYRWHKFVMIPMHQGDQLVGWLGTGLDIDEISRARQALEETTELLRLAQEGAGAGSWDFDLVGQTVLFSPETARLLGRPGDEPTTMTIADWQKLVHAQDSVETLRRVEEAVASRKTLETEFRVTLPDGGERWVAGIGRTYYDDAGNAVRMIGLNFDITARKDAELALHHAKNAAEGARLEAERASAAKTDFLASMSHEIRTPLNAVIGFTDLLAGSNRLPPDLRRQAELARSSGAALLTVVNDILDFSEVEAGRIELEPRPFAPAALVDNCLSIVRGSATAKALELHASLDESLPRGLLGDEGRLRQVLLNLLNNAVKFTRHGCVTLTLRYEGWSLRGEQVRFSVSDTGIGIPKDKLHRLFERFSQVDGSIRRDFGGSGLGLAICRRLVEMMGGEIGVVSEEGRGATFWFSLTLPRAGLPSTLTAVTAVPAARKRGKLLLVEDVEINQELACAVLEAVGHAVDVVGDGQSALTAVQAVAYDLVLMDVQMPGMDGMTATRLIRSLDGPARTVPIVAMTANVLPGEVVQFRQAGMNDHVGKPFNRAHLYAVIDRWLPGDPVSADTEPSIAMPMPLDHDVFSDLVALHKPDGAIRLLGFLDEELKRSFVRTPASPEDRDHLRREAHVLVSAAGMLGFAALSSACAELEACGEDRASAETLAFDRELDRVRAAAAAAMAESRRLSETLRTERMRGAAIGG